jgi:hypothetical protein
VVGLGDQQYNQASWLARLMLSLIVSYLIEGVCNAVRDQLSD